MNMSAQPPPPKKNIPSPGLWYAKATWETCTLVCELYVTICTCLKKHVLHAYV